MTEIVNLRTQRKRAKRLKAEQEAAANRLVHGRSKAERKFDRAQSARAVTCLDQHRIITGARK
jgi:hypothetical protein